MLDEITRRMRARNPFWGLYPSARLSVIVLGAALLWLIPGEVGVIAAAVVTVRVPELYAVPTVALGNVVGVMPVVTTKV